MSSELKEGVSRRKVSFIPVLSEDGASTLHVGIFFSSFVSDTLIQRKMPSQTAEDVCVLVAFLPDDSSISHFTVPSFESTEVDICDSGELVYFSRVSTRRSIRLPT